MTFAFVPGVEPPAATEGARWIAFRKGEPLVTVGDEPLPFPGREVIAKLAPLDEAQYIGALDGTPLFAVLLPEDAAAPEGFTFGPMRPLFLRLPEPMRKLVGRALQIVEWNRTHRFCGACATPTERVPKERARKCPACGLTAYPRIAPAIIVLVQRGDEALLARAANFPGAFFSTLAGFVEPGESLEETLAREVAEEVGVAVKNLRYVGSQPWPFPHSLMVGFMAEYAGGEIAIDRNEIEEAAWFRYDALPKIPPRISIARRLIDLWIEERTNARGA
jgi:NAD+ diphosphatase